MLVGVAQLASGQKPDENRDRAVRAVEEAGRQQASLVVLPEATQVGFGSPGTDLRSLAEPIDGPFVTELCAAARSSGLVAVAGLFEPSPDPGLVYNTLVVVGPEGVRACYRKVHLYDALGWRESDRVAPGDPAKVGALVEVDELQVGVMTCFDLRFPEMARVLVDRGATAIAVPAAWVAGPGKGEQWEILLRARAIESTAYVLAAAQPEPAYTGRSMVVDPAGCVLAALDGSAGEDGVRLCLAEVSAARVQDVRAGMPVLAQRRFEVRPA